MLDPRQEIMEMIHSVREQLNKLEMKLWEIPHDDEPIALYTEVFVAPVVGDYLHPSTPTHQCPEGLGEGAYWDECCQCWMAPNEYEWDDSNLFTNYHTDMTYLPTDGNVWVEESVNDWSNSYADDWYVAPAEIVEEYPVQLAPAHFSGVTSPEPEQVEYSINEIDQAPMTPTITVDALMPDQVTKLKVLQNMPASDFHKQANVDIYYHDDSVLDHFRQHTPKGNADTSDGSIEG